MFGHLIVIRPWFLVQAEKGELKRMRDPATLQIEECPPLRVQYLSPRKTAALHYLFSTRSVNQGIFASPSEASSG